MHERKEDVLKAERQTKLLKLCTFLGIEETGEQEGKEIEESEKKLFWDSFYFPENWVLKLDIKSPCKYV